MINRSEKLIAAAQEKSALADKLSDLEHSVKECNFKLAKLRIDMKAEQAQRDEFLRRKKPLLKLYKKACEESIEAQKECIETLA